MCQELAASPLSGQQLATSLAKPADNPLWVAKSLKVQVSSNSRLITAYLAIWLT